MAVPESAQGIVVQFLRTYGLENLATWAWDRYRDLGGGSTAFDQIELEMPDTPEYQSRFPAYKRLTQLGRAMSTDEMLSYERTAKQLMSAAGLPAGFYDSPDDFAELMANEVSNVELQSRITLAQTAAYNAPPETRQALTDMYGIDDGAFTAMFLDPDRALPVIQQRYVAAQTSGEARRIGMNITQGAAEEIAKRDVSEQELRQGFGELAERRGLYEDTAEEAGTGQTVTGDEAVTAQFGVNPNAARRIRQRSQRRLAAFQGSAGYGVGKEGVTGLGQPGTGGGQ